jgi:hypothetical protein
MSFLRLSILLLLAAGCAQVREPTGGDKDTTPPQLLHADPPNGSTHFKARRISLEFNEKVRTERVRDRLLISPPLPEDPVVRVVRGRTVTIDLPEGLKPSTTYIFGVGEAIVDMTEGNPASGLAYVVSTGAFLDSLGCFGTVVNALNGQPIKDALVLLHEAADDSLGVRRTRPAYFTRSDEKGSFSLEHLREGAYLLYALVDKNANKRFDLPNEEIAFLSDTLLPGVPDSLMEPLTLRLFREESAVQQLVERRVMSNGAFRVVFARPAGQVQLRDVLRTGGTLRWTQEWNKGRDTLLLWPSDTTALRAGAYALREDTTALDTLRYRPAEKMPFHVGLEALPLHPDPDLPPLVRASRPIAQVDEQRISLIRDSVPVPVRLATDTSGLRHLQVVPLDGGSGEGTLTLLPRALRDIYGGHNDTLRIRVGSGVKVEFGRLQIQWQVDSLDADGPFLLQLLLGQDRMAREIPLEDLATPTDVDFLAPGSYTLRLIHDANANGRWDPGKLSSWTQPERVWNHAGTVNIRANWDLKVDWRIR